MVLPFPTSIIQGGVSLPLEGKTETPADRLGASRPFTGWRALRLPCFQAGFWKQEWKMGS